MAAFVERDKENTGKKHNFDYNSIFVLIFNVQGFKALRNYNIIRISIKT